MRPSRKRLPDEPATVESIAPLPFQAYAFDFPVRNANGWTREFAEHAIAMCIADRTLRMTKPELMAFIAGADEHDEGTAGIMLRAIDAAHDTFEGWTNLLSLARTRYLVAASAEHVEREGQRAQARPAAAARRSPRRLSRPRIP